MSKEWFKAAGIRAIRTMAQAAIGAIGAATLISQVSWLEAFSGAILAGIMSMLMSLAGLPEVHEEEDGE